MQKLVLSVVGVVCAGLVGCVTAPEDDARVEASDSALTVSTVVPPPLPLPTVTASPPLCYPGQPPLSGVFDHAFCGTYTDGCGNVQTVQCPKDSNTYCLDNVCEPLPQGFCVGECPPGTECDGMTHECKPTRL